MTEFQFDDYFIRTSNILDELIHLLKIADHGFAICTYDDLKTFNFFNAKLKERGKKNGILMRDKVYDEKEEDLIAYLESEKNNFSEKIKEKIQKISVSYEHLSFSIRGLETKLESNDVGRLNVLRDYFLSFDYFVLLWIPSVYLRDISEKIPDFWRIRRKVFQFDKSEKHDELGKNKLEFSPYDAQQFFEKSLSINPKNSISWNDKGIALLKQSKYQQAILSFKNALELNSKSVQFLNNYGVTFCLSKKHNQSLSYFETALKIDKTDSMVLINYGLALTKLSSFRQAISCFNKIKKSSPDNKYASLFLSRVYVQTSRLNNAKILLKSILESYPNFVDAMITLGVTETKLGNYEYASELFSRALTLEPTNSKILVNQAILLSKRKKFTAAIYHLDQVLNFTPNHSEAIREKKKILKKLS